MIKLDFPWYINQAKNVKTKRKLKEFEIYFLKLKNKNGLVELRQKINFPLALGNYKIWLNNNNVFQSLHTYLEIFKENDHTILDEFVKEDMKIIFDIGANEGHYLLKIREKIPYAKIISVEPNPEAFRILKKNVTENKIKNVILVNRAVSSGNGIENFEIVKGITQVGALKIYGEKWFGKNRIKKIKVKTITLENLINTYDTIEVDLLKIDAEGTELRILKSSKNILDIIKRIVVEFHSESIRNAIIKYLKKHGFKLLFDEKKIYGDLYFVKSGLNGKRKKSSC